MTALNASCCDACPDEHATAALLFSRFEILSSKTLPVFCQIITSFKMIENRYIRYQKLSQYIKQKIPFKHFYSQHQWFLLNRRHTLLILKNNVILIIRNITAKEKSIPYIQNPQRNSANYSNKYNTNKILSHFLYFS